MLKSTTEERVEQKKRERVPDCCEEYSANKFHLIASEEEWRCPKCRTEWKREGWFAVNKTTGIHYYTKTLPDGTVQFCPQGGTVAANLCCRNTLVKYELSFKENDEFHCLVCKTPWVVIRKPDRSSYFPLFLNKTNGFVLVIFRSKSDPQNAYLETVYKYQDPEPAQ